MLYRDTFTWSCSILETVAREQEYLFLTLFMLIFLEQVMLKLSCFDLFFLRNARHQIPNCIVHITNHNSLLSLVLSTFKKYMTEINEDTKKKLCWFCLYLTCFILDTLLNIYYSMAVIRVNLYSLTVLTQLSIYLFKLLYHNLCSRVVLISIQKMK